MSRRSKSTAVETAPPSVPVASSFISAKEKAVIMKDIALKYGELTARLVVVESNPDNPAGLAHRLADLVGWNTDDATAANHWRTDQARAVIRSVEPELIQLGVMRISAPAYVHDPTKAPGEQGYVPILSLKTREDVAGDTMRSEMEQAVAALQRAYAIAIVLEKEEEAAGFSSALAVLGRSPVASAETGVSGLRTGTVS